MGDRDGFSLRARITTNCPAKVEFHFGELFPRVGFIVTNLRLPSRAGSTAIAVANSGADAVKIGTRRSSLYRHLI